MNAHEGKDPVQMPEKMPTGIEGFDEISGGGLPRNRTTLLIGSPGSGKTIFALHTLVNGARLYGEPGIFIAFEENSQQIFRNAASFGWDLPSLAQKNLFFIDAHMGVDTIQTGSFDLGGLLAGVKKKAEEMSAAANGAPVRIIFDAVDVLLSHLRDPYSQQREIYRIHEWLEQNVFSGIITAKGQPGERHAFQDYGFMQYMADCVIVLKREVIERVSHRTLTVVKYRGSRFAENEFDVVIGKTGIEVPSLSIFDLRYPVSSAKVSSGVERLDGMLNGGYMCGSSILITGAPGTAKSTLAGAFVEAACKRGEHALYISFDEGPSEIKRNLSSVSIDLETHEQSGMLCLFSSRAEAKSAVEHLVQIKRLVKEHAPAVMVIDPLSAMVKAGGPQVAKTVAQRLIYETKAAGITLLMTSLLEENDPSVEATPMEISTISDTWIHLSYVVLAGERNRALTIIKSRGTSHSNQVRELILSDDGVSLKDIYTAGGEVLMGTLRFEKEVMEQRAMSRRKAEAVRRRREVELKRAEANARLEALKHEIEAHEAEMDLLESEEGLEDEQFLAGQAEVRRLRGSDHEELRKE